MKTDAELIHMANMFIYHEIQRRHKITFYQFVQAYEANRHEQYLLGVTA